MTDNHKLACEKWRANNKTHISNYDKDYNKTHRAERTEQHLNWVKDNRNRNREIAKNSRLKNNDLKYKLIREILGKKCLRCGYESDIMRAFDIHHKNPKLKENDKTRDRLSFKSFKKWLLENKENLILLCATCHREIHHLIKY